MIHKREGWRLEYVLKYPLDPARDRCLGLHIRLSNQFVSPLVPGPRLSHSAGHTVTSSTHCPLSRELPVKCRAGEGGAKISWKVFNILY